MSTAGIDPGFSPAKFREIAIMDSQILEFLQADRHAILATKGRHGAPQLTPVWYIYEDGVIYVSAQTRTVKIKNLRRDPTVTICIDGGRGDARYVVLYGSLSPDSAFTPFWKDPRCVCGRSP